MFKDPVQSELDRMHGFQKRIVEHPELSGLNEDERFAAMHLLRGVERSGFRRGAIATTAAICSIIGAVALAYCGHKFLSGSEQDLQVSDSNIGAAVSRGSE